MCNKGTAFSTYSPQSNLALGYTICITDFLGEGGFIINFFSNMVYLAPIPSRPLSRLVQLTFVSHFRHAHSRTHQHTTSQTSYLLVILPLLSFFLLILLPTTFTRCPGQKHSPDVYYNLIPSPGVHI